MQVVYGAVYAECNKKMEAKKNGAVGVRVSESSKGEVGLWQMGF